MNAGLVFTRVHTACTSLAAIAARATRSASRRGSASSSSDDDSRCLLLALSHDELGVIFDGLADPLQPVVAVALSSTCLGLRTPLGPALEVLWHRHARAEVLCRKVGMMHRGLSCAMLREAEEFDCSIRGLTAADMATLAMILRTNGLPLLRRLHLNDNVFGDAGMQALCDGLGRGAAPSLITLGLRATGFGLAGAEALAATLHRGAWPKLERLVLSANPIGSTGVAALASPLRKQPVLRELHLVRCDIGDEGVASLMQNLGKDDFKALEDLVIAQNLITDVGMNKLVATIEIGGLPKFKRKMGLSISLYLGNNPASGAAIQAVRDALDKRSQ